MTTPPTPCELLAAAQQQLLRLASGQQTVVVETPHLGRVEYNRGTVGDLQRLIDLLNAQCQQSLGMTPLRRRPLSVEGLP